MTMIAATSGAKNAPHQLGASLTLNQLPTHRFGRFLPVIARSRRCGGVEREDADCIFR
jgi:hypothetical protein